MNAFDATRSGAGDAGLTSLFAALLAPAPGQGVPGTATGAVPFAQLLDQLAGSPAPQLGTTSAPSIRVEAGADQALAVAAPQSGSASLALPVQTNQRRADRVPVRPLECGLHVPGTGKMLPVAATDGTILPVEAEAGALKADATVKAAEPEMAEQPAESMMEAVGRPQPLIVAPVIPAVMQPRAITPAMPTGSAGSRFARTEFPVTSAVPPTATAPVPSTTPAVTLTVAEAPSVPTTDVPNAPERPGREAVLAAPAPRPNSAIAADLHGASGTSEPAAALPQSAAAPQQQVMQDLTQIVERLAAAREAAAPAATQLAVQHAEFGPLSLSIEQGGRGELAIAVTAADRGSQAALVAAIAQAEAPAFEQTPERRDHEMAERESAWAGPQGEQRGQGAQKDRSPAQAQRHTLAEREPAREQDGETRSGTYA